MLLHVLLLSDAAVFTPPLHPPSLDAEGFIHCCHPHQLQDVLTRHFHGHDEVMVLPIDPQHLPTGLRVVDEDLYGHGAFPHIYGEVPAAALGPMRRCSTKNRVPPTGETP